MAKYRNSLQDIDESFSICVCTGIDLPKFQHELKIKTLSMYISKGHLKLFHSFTLEDPITLVYCTHSGI